MTCLCWKLQSTRKVTPAGNSHANQQSLKASNVAGNTNTITGPQLADKADIQPQHTVPCWQQLHVYNSWLVLAAGRWPQMHCTGGRQQQAQLVAPITTRQGQM